MTAVVTGHQFTALPDPGRVPTWTPVHTRDAAVGVTGTVLFTSLAEGAHRIALYSYMTVSHGWEKYSDRRITMMHGKSPLSGYIFSSFEKVEGLDNFLPKDF